MATLSPAFRVESERIHGEHQSILEELVDLERGLERMECHAQVLADPVNAEQVRRLTQHLAGELPDHCRREEERVLDAVSEVSAELCDFCRRMREEHQILLAQLEFFRQALDNLGNDADRQEALQHLKDEGARLTRALRQHILLEEHELSGFL
jgi:iron-sulfur cluster repair protein YtfE (RIC family)